MLRIDDVRAAVCRQICATFFVFSTLTLPLSLLQLLSFIYHNFFCVFIDYETEQ